MVQGTNPGTEDEQRKKMAIDWEPILIVIAATYMSSIAFMSQLGQNLYEAEYRLGLILCFFAVLSLASAIILAIYANLDRARRTLVAGIVIVLIMLAIKTEAYLRSSL